MRNFDLLLEESVARHGHLCPGQVLGVRLAMLGCRLLELDPDVPAEQRRLLLYVEIDRCATDAIGSVTGCQLGRRTLKFVDYGKMAATFVDERDGRGVRVVARDDARTLAAAYAPAAATPRAAQLAAYALMPDEELFAVQRVQVAVPEWDLPGPPRRRVACALCGEGVNDGRDVVHDGKGPLCRACAGQPYYRPAEVMPTASPVSQLAPAEAAGG